MEDDFSSTTSTSGRVAVGGTASGNIETAHDRDWFAVELVAGRTYTIDLRGSATDDGTLSDPRLYGIHDADRNVFVDSTDDDGGDGRNSRVTFTATESGTHYIAAGAFGSRQGTYTVEVTDNSPADTDSQTDTPTPTDADATRTGAVDLGNITALQGPRFPRGTLDGDADGVDYYRFTLTEAKRVGLGLRQQDADADLFLEDANGTVLYSSTASGTGNEVIDQTLLAGTYYVRVESQEAGVNAHVVRYGVSAPDADALAALQQQSGTVTDEAPTFGQQGYAFALAENADGSTSRVSLGTVAATDPEGSTPVYSLVGDSDSFEIDAASGELFYTGAGEDFESGTTRFTLTVRASDGSETTDTTVTVNVTDVEETVHPPVADEDPSTPQTVSEPEDEDNSADTSTGGRVAVGETATGDIGSASDRDWFAVELVAGRRYTIDLRGSPTDDGTLSDPRLYGIHDADGNLIARTTNDDWGGTYNSQVTFTATETATHYIAAGAFGYNQGTYTVEVTDDSPADTDPQPVTTTDTTSTPDTTTPTDADAARTGAVDFGNITALQGPRFPRGTLDGDADGVDYYRFTLTEAKRVGLGLRQQDADADLFLEDANGTVLYSSTASGTGNEVIDQTLLAGTYYVRVESQEAGVNAHVVRYGVSAPDADALAALQQQSGTGTDEAPTFGQQGYAFALAENADGGTERVSLGTVAATDPEGATLAYRLVGGNESGSFDIDEASGELFYTGSGEDFESDTTRFTLTVRVSDGSETTDTTVNVNVTDVNETPVIRVADVEATEGDDTEMLFRVMLESASSGTVTVNYATADGTAVAGEDYTATSGTLTFAPGETEKTVAVAIIDDTVEDSGETFRLLLSDPSGATLEDGEAIGTIRNTEGSVSEPSGGDLPANTTTTGAVAVGDSATGEIGPAADIDWFEVELVAGKTYRVDLKGSTSGAGTLGDPYLRGIYDTNRTLVRGTINDDADWLLDINSRVIFTASKSGTYYVAAGARGQDEGSYTLSVREIEDDYQATAATTGTVAVGGSTRGNIQYVDDIDWFAVELDAGKVYRVDMKGLQTSSGTLRDAYLLGVRDANGTLLPGTFDNESGTGHNSRVEFAVTEAGRYYVAAGAFEHHEGSYTLSVSELSGVSDDYLATTGTTGVVSVDNPTTGTIDFLRDTDWFKVDLEAGKIYRFDLEGSPTGAGTLSDPYLHGIYDANGTLLPGTVDDESGTGHNSRVEFTATETGTYYVDVGASYRTETGTYKLSVSGLSDDYAATTGTTGAVSVGGSTTGNMEFGRDIDWFKVELEASKTYRFDLEGSPSGAGTLRDPFLYGIHDANGARLTGTADDDGGRGKNSRVEFTAAETGTYYVAAWAYKGDEGTYRLSVRDLGDASDDYSRTADTADTIGTVAVGGSTTGNVDYVRDVDWFAVTLEAGKGYRFDLEGSPSGAGTLRDPYLHGIHDAQGTLLADTTDNDSGTGDNSRVEFVATESGTYYIAAGAHRWHQKGTYKLSVSELEDDYLAAIGTTGDIGTVSVGGSTTGDIEFAGDVDLFAVDLVVGKTYRFDLESWITGAGTVFDPYLRGIHAANGTLISGTTDDDGGVGDNSRVEFTASATGTYYVAAGAKRAYEGTYTLSVEEVDGM